MRWDLNSALLTKSFMRQPFHQTAGEGKGEEGRAKSRCQGGGLGLPQPLRQASLPGPDLTTTPRLPGSEWPEAGTGLGHRSLGTGTEELCGGSCPSTTNRLSPSQILLPRITPWATSCASAWQGCFSSSWGSCWLKPGTAIGNPEQEQEPLTHGKPGLGFMEHVLP